MQHYEELQDLVERIEQWSYNLGLDKNSNPIQQNLKMLEEFGELAKAIQKRQTLDIMDGLGDTIVVGAVMATQIRKYVIGDKLPLGSQLNVASDVVPISMPLGFYFADKAVHRYVTYCVDTSQQAEGGTYLYSMFKDFVTSVNGLANALNLSLVECVKMAYSTIHFRSGEIVNGVFVKKIPEATITLPLKILTESIDTIIKNVEYYANNNGLRYYKINFSDKVEYVTH